MFILFMLYHLQYAKHILYILQSKVLVLPLDVERRDTPFLLFVSDTYMMYYMIYVND